MKKIYGTFVVEMRAYGQKLVKFCKHTDTPGNLSSIDVSVNYFRYYFSGITTRTALLRVNDSQKKFHVLNCNLFTNALIFSNLQTF